MLDIKAIRENPDAVERALATRGAAVSLAPVLVADAERRRLKRLFDDAHVSRDFEP